MQWAADTIAQLTLNLGDASSLLHTRLREQLALRIEDDQLIIEGALTMPAPADMEASYAEMQRPRYRRTFTLSRELDTGRIGAELTQGVLKLRIPKAESAQPRRIAIQVP